MNQLSRWATEPGGFTTNRIKLNLIAQYWSTPNCLAPAKRKENKLTRQQYDEEQDHYSDLDEDEIHEEQRENKGERKIIFWSIIAGILAALTGS